MSLTPSQRKTYDLVKNLFRSYQAVAIQSECCSGKHYVASRLLSRMVKRGFLLREFNLCEVCKNLTHRITGQDFATYLESLSEFPKGTEFCKKSGGGIIIYIRRIDTVMEIICEYG